MTDIKLLIANLRKLASAATPGPWAAEHTSYDLDSPQSGPSKISAGKEVVVEGYYPYENSGVNSPNDARFIAACDPQTVTRLCDKLEEAIALANFYDSMSTWADVKNLMAQTNADPGVEAHDVFGEKAREFLKSLTPQ